MWTQIWVNIGSGNGLLPDGTMPLTEPMLTYYQVFSGIHLKTIAEIVYISLIYNMCLEITFLKLLPHLPGANKLTQSNPMCHFLPCSKHHILIEAYWTDTDKHRRLFQYSAWEKNKKCQQNINFSTDFCIFKGIRWLSQLLSARIFYIPF